MPALILHGLERSVYTRIARLALEEKGLLYELVDTEIFGPGVVPAAHRARHPFGRIPVLAHGGFELYETAAIARYVDEAFDGPALQPADPRERARMNQIIGLLDAYAYRPMVWGVFVERRRAAGSGTPPDEGRIAESLAAARTCLSALEALARFKPYLLGPQPGLADCHAFPMLRCFSLVPDGEHLLGEFPALQAWLGAMLARPSVRRTRSRLEPA